MLITNIVEKVSLPKCELIHTIAYSHKHSILFAFDINHRIVLFNMNGKQLQTVQLDKLDEVTYLDSVGD